MRVNALDHVNIVTDSLDESAEFYARLLDLERRDGPAPFTPEQMQWLCDAAGRPIIHLNSAHYRGVGGAPGGTTGAIDHVALDCTGCAELIARLDAMGADYRVNRIESIGLTQVFTRDPNNVKLELNFRGA